MSRTTLEQSEAAGVRLPLTEGGGTDPSSVVSGAAPGSVAPTRVLWLINGLGQGGAERLLVSAAGAHDRARFAFTAAYLLPWKNALVPALEAAGVRCVCLDALRRGDLRWVWRLRRLVAQGDFDVVHVHSPLVAAATRGVVHTLPSGRRPPIVATEHNRWASFRVVTRILNGMGYRSDAAHLAVSAAVRASIWPKLQASVEVLLHGVAVDDLVVASASRDAMRAELGIGDGEVVAITVANFRANKAYPDLLAAAAALVRRNVPVRFLAVGQGPLEAELRARLRRLELGGAFEILGRRDDVPRLLAAADLFVLASVHEGFPVAVMEAAVMGLPVVATDVGGLPEAVTDGVDGRLVPAGRPDLLADAIAELVVDPERRRRMSVAATARGADYQIARAVKRIEEIYRAASAVPRGSTSARSQPAPTGPSLRPGTRWRGWSGRLGSVRQRRRRRAGR